MSRLPRLNYPVTRSFPGVIFSTAAFAGAGVILVFLFVINTALAGYETVTGFDSDFNVTQHLWYDAFLPSVAKTKPGTLCDARLLGLGDTITTNYTMFQYTISAIDTANAGDSGFSYQGWTLENCDITSLYVNGNAQTFIIDYTALITCKADANQILSGNDFSISARTDWSESLLAGSSGSPLGAQKALRNRQAGTYNASKDARGSVLNSVMVASSTEFASRIFAMLELSNHTTPLIVSFEADFPWCPASLGPDAPCATQVPPVNVTGLFLYLANGTLAQYSAGDPTSTTGPPTDDTAGIIANTVQAVYAAVRLDLGNLAPNNFLVNTTMIPQAILQTFPQTYPPLPGIALANESFLYSLLVNDGFFSEQSNKEYDIPGLLPLAAPGPAAIDGVYLCRFQRVKSPGSAFIAVLVATLSMFSSGWALFIVMAAAALKSRMPSANTCSEHASAGRMAHNSTYAAVHEKTQSEEE
ncbi:hypothetical protein GGX14DRAFT_500612 [Mycena pura]|uniref:Transmembrane protein n=1 Tax=Mycena pura TaxID=153505 RepID=A0AAD6V7V7_9AGAR|nr:hypothetical protein GGX14DRAFT_500612 [Mycena pura]